ncbi:MAG: hypothetical protein R2706_21205 [Acidimicrobiales bacterium]
MLEIAEQEVDIEAPLMGLVNDDRVVRALSLRSRWISASKMPSVMVLDLGRGGHLVVEPNGVANRPFTWVPISLRSAPPRFAAIRRCVANESAVPLTSSKTDFSR